MDKNIENQLIENRIQINKLNKEVRNDKLILPRIKKTEFNSDDLIPEKYDIYSKIKIRDLIQLRDIAKPLFK